MKRIVTLLFVVVSSAIAAPPAKDAYPAGCVDCHINDHRLSTMLAQWNGKVDAKKVAAMQTFVPKGITLKGKHPPVAKTDIPRSCLKCHTGASKTIPPLAPLMHGIHFTRTTPMAIDCLNCHKLNKATGVISVASGAEK